MIPDINLDAFAALSGPAMAAMIEQSIASGEARCKSIEDDYVARITPTMAIASMLPGEGGLMHAASLLAWNEIAALVDVPAVPAELITSLPMNNVYAYMECQLDPRDPDFAPFQVARDYIATGGFWRTNLCASGDVKYQLSNTGLFTMPRVLDLDDPRIIDMHYGLPAIDIIARPTMTPKRINGFPIEFRVFFGGQAEQSGAVAFYYPQAGAFTPTDELIAAAEEARIMAQKMFAKREELGLVPMLPGGPEGTEIGATLDFMLTEDEGLVFIDAGPGYGYGAHPCTFIDSPVEGTRWHLAPGVTPR